MSQMHQQPAGSAACPGCEEPLEPGDLFCGACGYDLSAVPPMPQDQPTVAISVGPRAAAAGSAELSPAAVRYDDPPQAAPADGDFALPAPAAAPVPPPAAAPVPPPAQAPVVPVQPVDPRTAVPVPEPTPPAGTPAAKVCVACRSGRIDEDGYCENCGHAQPRERDHMEQELDAVAAVSDRGLRHHRNEDSFAVSSAALPDGSPAVVAIVCDGVSSATRPDEASAAAASAANEALLESLPRGTHPQQAMHEAIVAAAESVNSLAVEPGHTKEHDPDHHTNAPACTLVGAIVASGLLVIGWVGDSRVYWVPDDRTAPPARLTEDDSWAAQMVAAGLMNEAEAYADERAHAITGWLGADAYELEPHTAAFKPDRPGVVVVCTDGLWNYAEAAQEMARVAPADAADRPLHCAQVLVGHALDGGGHDNVTVAVLPFPVPPQGAGSAYGTA
ncbi:protein phosphatase 2C domain-containing protein [Streptomyces sp. ISL-98]|uniref:protein phosphatase 2C domain-containing protein n=1 Tax=Streptomyces sp. ISL-98 TaxID=2819192 RepID=UPI001BE906C4|nr:protein phosphatase 2C domain-containing protein [Streptomyces sp. ISL-98]MBT2505281.1 protein phosphatase 2C domain-containing protein [Streptomyces sp. ISL-98]